MHNAYSKLEKDFKFYSDYHQHKYNKLVHIIFIPCICWSLFIFLNCIPYSITFNISNINIIECSLSLKCSFILYLFYIIYYVYLAPFIGLICGIFYLGILYIANLFSCYYPGIWKYAIIIQILS